MKTLIVSNGEALSSLKLKKISQEVNLIICADGGAKHLLKNDIIPDVLIGDFDSISKLDLDIMNKKNVELVKYPVKKDKTDTELAMDFALEKKTDEIIFVGATGSRLDHTIANIMLLYQLMKKGVKGKIIDNNNEITIVNDELTIKRENNSFVSVIPLFGSKPKVTLSGFDYDTEKVEFEFGSTLGISNKVKKNEGKIKVDNGVCLVTISRD